MAVFILQLVVFNVAAAKPFQAKPSVAKKMDMQFKGDKKFEERQKNIKKSVESASTKEYKNNLTKYLGNEKINNELNNKVKDFNQKHNKFKTVKAGKKNNIGKAAEKAPKIKTSVKSSTDGEPLAGANPTVIDEMENIGVWNFAYGADASVDNTNKVSGEGAIKLIKNNVTTNYFALQGAVTCDLSKSSDFGYSFYVADKTNIASIGLVLFTDDVNYSSYYVNYFGNWEMTNGWNTVKRNIADFSPGGTPDLSQIKAIRFVVNLVSDQATEVNFDKITTSIQGTQGKSEILFNFEDGYYETYTKALPMLESKGFKATVWPIKSYIDYQGMEFLDEVDLENLYRAGWDIGNITVNYPTNFSSMTYEQKKAEYQNAKLWLEAKGWTRAANTVTYPLGYYDQDILNIMTELNIKAARGNVYGIQSVPVENMYNLKTISIGSEVPVSLIKTEIDNAIATGSTVMLTVHKIADTATNSYTTSTAQLQEIVDYVAAKTASGDIEVATMSKWLSDYEGLPYTPVVPQEPIVAPVPGDYSRIVPFSEFNTQLKTSNGTQVNSFDSISEWSNVRRATIYNDTANKMEGTASLKLASQVVNGGGSFMVESDGLTTSNLSAMDNLQMGIYTDDPSKIISVSVALYSETDYHSNYYISYIGAYELEQGWNKIIRTKSDFQSCGSPDFANIKSMRISVYAKDGQNPVIGVDDFRYGLKGKTRILFTFDDAWRDVWTKGYNIMNAKGYKGTLWAVKEFAENEPVDFLTVSELDNMYSLGWDVGNHSTDHNDAIAEMTDEEARANYQTNLNWLKANGWTRSADHVCYPQGSHDLELVEVLKSIGVKTARTTIYGIQPVATEDIYRLKTIPVGKDIPMELIKHEIDKAIATGSSLMFMYHKIEDNPTEVFSISTAAFQEIVDYVKQKDDSVPVDDLKVQTISEWYDEYMNMTTSVTSVSPTQSPSPTPKPTRTRKRR